MLQCGEPCKVGEYQAKGSPGLDKFGSVHDWVKGPVGHFMHDSCRLTFSNTKKLEQAQKINVRWMNASRSLHP